MELTGTAYVILGMLRNGPRTGYEIKAAVDHSTRFFWAASYGQIYPELKQLAEAGLVKGESSPQQPPETFELRDEALLKLFFSGAASPESAAAALAAKRRYHEEKLAQLRAIEPLARESSDSYPYMVLRHGIELSEWTVEWCKRAERELSRAMETAA